MFVRKGSRCWRVGGLESLGASGQRLELASQVIRRLFHLHHPHCLLRTAGTERIRNCLESSAADMAHGNVLVVSQLLQEKVPF